MKTFKSILIKLSAVTAIAITGLFASNSIKPVSQVEAATQTVSINYVPGYGIAVWNNYQNGSTTGQYLTHGSQWKVISTSTDTQGNTWYDLGMNQWIMAKYTVDGSIAQAATSSETAAKNWIANRESGGNYNARNGQYIGKYQLSSAYLGGNYSAANQEKVANNYVMSRYGSWVNAKNFWLSHGWY